MAPSPGRDFLKEAAEPSPTTPAAPRRDRSWRSLRIASGGALAIAGLLGAQSPAPITLQAGTVGPGFTKVGAVRELEDGRTLVVDLRERILTVVDWSSTEPRQIGRVGAGPGEYRAPSRLLALRGDSTLLTDGQTRRSFILVGDRITSTLPPDRPLFDFVSSTPAGTDTADRVLLIHGSLLPALVPDPTPAFESLAVIVVHRGNRAADTIAAIRGPFRGQNRIRRRVGEGTLTTFTVNPLAVGDQAWLFADGWIATLYVDPYRVEWRSPSGSVVRGNPLPYTRQSVDERVKKQVIDDRFPRSPDAPEWATTDFVGWPEVVPPFLNDALTALPDGRIAIRRTSFGANRVVQYDIVDRQGNLAGVLRLPLNERIAGAGKRSVYVVATNDDGIEVLRRHPWP